MVESVALTALVLIAALLYSSVGHGGASGYLAAMALCSVAPEVMKPMALVLNLLVSSVGTIRYGRAGHFSWQIFWPFAVTSIPSAFAGGMIRLPDPTYRLILGLVLLFAAGRLAMPNPPGAEHVDKGPPLTLALPLGAGMGFLSGLTGVGGGIFLSPVLLLANWAGVRQTAGVSVTFILVNSAAGLGGHWRSVESLPRSLLWLAPAALVGGIWGSELGSRKLAPIVMRRLLAAVLVVAALKLLLTK